MQRPPTPQRLRGRREHHTPRVTQQVPAGTWPAAPREAFLRKGTHAQTEFPTEHLSLRLTTNSARISSAQSCPRYFLFLRMDAFYLANRVCVRVWVCVPACVTERACKDNPPHTLRLSVRQTCWALGLRAISSPGGAGMGACGRRGGDRRAPAEL